MESLLDLHIFEGIKAIFFRPHYFIFRGKFGKLVRVA